METSLKPAFDNNNIPMVFSTDENFIPYLDVCLKSLVANSSSENNYDIVILYSNVSEYAKNRLASNKKDNISIRFVNMDSYMEQYQDVWYIHWGWSNAVYYRFFIPEIFAQYKKALFLDGDIIINFDIKELFDTELGDNYLGAIQDISQQMTGYSGEQFREEVLKIEREKYFNAGILVLNLDELRKSDFFNKCIKTLIELENPPFQDQDVMNLVCRDRVKYLPFKYNQLWNCTHFFKDAADRMKKEIFDDYIAAWNDVKIIHYAGVYKPWKQPWLEYSDYFWKYARQSSFYEEIIYRNQSKGLGRGAIKNVVRRKRIYMQYLKCKFLRIFTFGRLKEHYCEKQERLKDQVRDYRRTLGK